MSVAGILDGVDFGDGEIFCDGIEDHGFHYLIIGPVSTGSSTLSPDTGEDHSTAVIGYGIEVAVIGQSPYEFVIGIWHVAVTNKITSATGSTGRIPGRDMTPF
ncbi:hypothetical protein DSECCO2_525720 [anaerobic digester metagenome]